MVLAYLRKEGMPTYLKGSLDNYWGAEVNITFVPILWTGQLQRNYVNAGHPHRCRNFEKIHKHF
jgi:hypothetical protein